MCCIGLREWLLFYALFSCSFVVFGFMILVWDACVAIVWCLLGAWVLMLLVGLFDVCLRMVYLECFAGWFVLDVLDCCVNSVVVVILLLLK